VRFEKLLNDFGFRRRRGKLGGDIGILQPVTIVGRVGIVKIAGQRIESAAVVALQLDADFDGLGWIDRSQVRRRRNIGGCVVGHRLPIRRIDREKNSGQQSCDEQQEKYKWQLPD
jgi:hypothetical protein